MIVKKLLFIGSVDKSMVALTFANAVASITQSTLIMDVTQRKEFSAGYANAMEGEAFVELTEEVDVVQGNDYLACLNVLKQYSQNEQNYDYVLINVDSLDGINNLPLDLKAFYFSDEENTNIYSDLKLMHRYLDTYKSHDLNRVHFSSPYGLNEHYFDLQMNNRIEWKRPIEVVEYDEVFLKLKLKAQHEAVVKLKQFSKSWREMLLMLIVEAGNTEELKQVAAALKVSSRSLNNIAVQENERELAGVL